MRTRTVQEAVDAPLRQQAAKKHILNYLAGLKLSYVEAWAVCDAISWELHRLNEELIALTYAVEKTIENANRKQKAKVDYMKEMWELHRLNEEFIK